MISNPFLENPAIYEIKWKNNVELYRSQMTIWRMHIECWIPKAKKTYSEYVIRVAFSLQQTVSAADATF